jgi:hypothetical protein
VAIHALTPSLVPNAAVGLHLYDAGGERIGVGAVVRDVDIIAAMWHGVDVFLTCAALILLANVCRERARARCCAPVAHMGDTFDGLAVEPVSET